MIRWKTTLSLLPLLSTALFVDDSIHHSIEYRIPDETSLLLQQEDDHHVVIQTRDQEQYTCALPQSNKEVDDDVNSYSGPTPWELIAPLKERNICTQRVDPFWSYEVCHGKYVRQFHESKEKLNFYLGNYHPKLSSYQYEKEKPNNDRIKVNGEELPYLPVVYSQVSTCKYDVVILTQLLCTHPLFRGAKTTINKIVCTSHNKESQPIPKSYTPLAIAQKAGFHASYAPTVDRVLKPSDSSSILDLTELYTKMERNHGFKKQADIRFDSSGLNEILSGTACLDSGGLDYWRYEYCHLNKVPFIINIRKNSLDSQIVQYHEISSTNRKEILLGVFNKEKHLKYLQDYPTKRPNKFDGKMVQVTLLYSGGMKCGDEPDKNFHREAEVRFRCSAKKNEDEMKTSKEDIEFSVIETSICNYIVTLESDSICRAIQGADINGLFSP
ncbi:hypothetical protein PRIPAC_87084 [Pristionchus pacificus]|nr:hypothetical protein PRIPAC_87084 [Pristionchus pacificus]|eukprot:PDM67391.1 hypothetical protein PRIPAC_48808 [Pristionchus pacificus]